MPTSERMGRRPGSAAAAVLDCLAVTALGAAQQSVAQSDSAATLGPGGLEEIVVTARRREENLQSAPLSVTAFTAAALERQGIDTLVDLGSHVPNLSMISGQGGGATQTQVSIRGVGQSDFILTSDQSVGLYVDGVYLPRSMGAALDLIDVERIEVLRGPQGTLFGRNNTAGAIQIVSAAPEDAFFGKGEVTTGSFDRLDFKGSINLPLGERVATRVSVASLSQEGYGKRLFDDTDGADTDVLAGRAAFRADLTDALQADLIVDYSRKRGHGGLERMVNVDTRIWLSTTPFSRAKGSRRPTRASSPMTVTTPGRARAIRTTMRSAVLR